MSNCMHRADMSDTCPHNDADPICPCRGCDLARRERIKAFCREHEARSIARAISGSYQTTSGGNRWEASPDNDQRPTSRPPRRDSYTPVRSYDGSCTASSSGWMDCACEWCSLRRYTNVVNACARQERQVQKTRRSCRVA